MASLFTEIVRRGALRGAPFAKDDDTARTGPRAPLRVEANPERDWCVAEALAFDEDAPPPLARSVPGLTSLQERSLLMTCARDHYSGEGLILDLGGLLGASAAALAAGVAANADALAILQRWARSGSKPILTFERKRARQSPQIARLWSRLNGAGREAVTYDLTVELPKQLGPHLDLVTPMFGDAAAHRLGPEAAELCFVDLGRGAPGLQVLVKVAGRAFIPGKTLLVVRDFYDLFGWRSNVMAGLLGDHLEWLGQVGSCAIFRVARTLPAELCGLDPFADLPPDACLRLHTAGDHPKLSLERRLDFKLSYVNLLALRMGPEAALDDLRSVRAEFEALASGPADRRIIERLCTFNERRLERMRAGAGAPEPA